MTVDLDAVRGNVIAFLVLHIVGGNIGIPIILFTIFISGKTVVRHAVFLNFCTTWIMFSGSYAFLFYAGQIDRPIPNPWVCLAQAAMIYGSSAMIGISIFVFTLHLFLAIRDAVHHNPPSRWHSIRLYSMLVAPYLAYLVVFLFAFLSGRTHPELVLRSSLYCTIKMKSIKFLGEGIGCLAVIVSIIIQTSTVFMLMRNWQEIQEAQRVFSLVFRTTIFTVCGIIGLLVCVAFLASSKSPVPNILLACFPMAVFLVFGTQPDMLRVWCFWGSDQEIKVSAPVGRPSDSSSPV